MNFNQNINPIKEICKMYLFSNTFNAAFDTERTDACKVQDPSSFTFALTARSDVYSWNKKHAHQESLFDSTRSHRIDLSNHPTLKGLTSPQCRIYRNVRFLLEHFALKEAFIFLSFLICNDPDSN